MAFKLYTDPQSAVPYMVCDVCGGQIMDLWNSKATGSPVQGQVVDVKVHHKDCVAPGNVSMPLIEFARLFAVRACIGDVGSNGQVDTAHVPYPTGRGFEA